jgi:hypothetical protein
MHRIALRNSARALAATPKVPRRCFLFSYFLIQTSPLYRVPLPPLLHVLMLLRSLVRSDSRISWSHCSYHDLYSIYRIAYVTLVAASEVSSILESRISGTAVGGNVEETGRVLSSFCLSPFFIWLNEYLRTGVGDGIGRVWGLRNVQGLFSFTLSCLS